MTGFGERAWEGGPERPGRGPARPLRTCGASPRWHPERAPEPWSLGPLSRLPGAGRPSGHRGGRRTEVLRAAGPVHLQPGWVCPRAQPECKQKLGREPLRLLTRVLRIGGAVLRPPASPGQPDASA